MSLRATAPATRDVFERARALGQPLLVGIAHPAVATFVVTRLAVWLLVLLAYAWSEPKPPPLAASLDAASFHDLGQALDVWARWDSGWFLTIAQDGYDARPDTAAFFPLYPTLVAAVGHVLGGHEVLAGVVVSLAAGVGAFVLLYHAAAARLGDEGARRAVLYLALFPTSIFLQAVYSESLFLFLVLAAFALAERDRWPAAGVVAGLALLTRAAGIAVLPALVLLAWRSKRRGEALASLALAPVLFLAYPFWLWVELGAPLDFTGAQERSWGRKLALLGPLDGVWRALETVGGSVTGLFTSEARESDWRAGASFNIEAQNLVNLLALVLFLALAVVVCRRLGAAYGVFTAASLLIPLSTPVHGEWPLLSLPRFMVVVFPLFLALALVGARPRAHTAIVACSAALLAFFCVQWATYAWVA